MARPKKPPTVTVRLPKELARKAALVAGQREQTVPEYLAEVLTPILETAYSAAVRKLADDAGLTKPRK